MNSVLKKKEKKPRQLRQKKQLHETKKNAKKAKQADDMNHLTDEENKLFLGSKQTNRSIEWRYNGLYS